MENYIEFYCKNDCAELRKISNKIITKEFGWLPQMLYDDFYSIALEVLWRCDAGFSDTKGAKFETYLANCLNKKFRTRVTYMNRQRRNGGIQDVSLDAMIDEKNISLYNLISHDDVETKTSTYSEKVTKYLERLSDEQRQILLLIADGYSVDEVKKILKISSIEFANAYSVIKSYRNVSILY